MDSETWKPVRPWPYEVSNLGRVRNARSGRVLRPCPLSDVPGHRYLRVTLYRRNRAGVRLRRDAYVHRLVALYHVRGRTQERCQVDHRNRDVWDNRSANLEWVSSYENLLRRHPELAAAQAEIDAHYAALPAEAPF